jgi:hypothetical protein
MPGATSALCLLPETGTAVVVLQNSLGLCDVADWVCQLTVDTIFTGNPACDYFPLIKRCVDKGVARMDELKSDLQARRCMGQSPALWVPTLGDTIIMRRSGSLTSNWLTESLYWSFLVDWMSGTVFDTTTMIRLSGIYLTTIWSSVPSIFALTLITGLNLKVRRARIESAGFVGATTSLSQRGKFSRNRVKEI